MTQKEKRDYILNLDKVVKRWRANSYLFAGGCCFSAGQIAKLLEKKNIKYSVVCWQCENPRVSSLKEIIVTNCCCHIAIQVTIGREKIIIGGNYGAFMVTNKRVYTNVKSKQIIWFDLLGLQNDAWNPKYNRNLNSRFTKVLSNAVSK
jgi:hypothetical protein